MASFVITEKRFSEAITSLNLPKGKTIFESVAYEETEMD
jgi:hypothetical protein